MITAVKAMKGNCGHLIAWSHVYSRIVHIIIVHIILSPTLNAG